MLSREFISRNSLSIRAGDALIDPLVINYGSASASVTRVKYEFDIDADGTLDQISFAGPGSEFLALDLNNDGIINDGRELFGPNSGDGFSDLAEYDLDKNGWIDENDAIYEKLRIWTKDAEYKGGSLRQPQRLYRIRLIFAPSHLSCWLFRKKSFQGSLPPILRSASAILTLSGATVSSSSHVMGMDTPAPFLALRE